MESEGHRDSGEEIEQATAAQFTSEIAPDENLAWEQVAGGRFMPRRIRGSFKGRALG